MININIHFLGSLKYEKKKKKITDTVYMADYSF